MGLNLSDAAFKVQSIQNNNNDEKWIKHWSQVWPHCRMWYLSEGLLRRPGYLTCLSALRSYMPEIEPLFLRLSEGTGGTDLASRFLSLYNPPPYMAGCSQAVWNKEELFLIKNYDYSPTMFEKTLFYSNWLKPVIGMLDCAWGLLDGINSDGLIASLTFGGKKEVGEGFGAPLILRYILETSNNVEDAKARIGQIPCHMAYNITLLDPSGAFTKVFLCPGQPAVFIEDPVSTNHQKQIEWLEYAEFSRTIERYNLLKQMLLDNTLDSEQLVKSFFEKPLFNVNFGQQFGTLYTVLYRPKHRNLSLLWQNNSIVQSFDNFKESKISVTIKDVNS